VKSILRRRPTPALVISVIALFVSLSGVSYGVATGFIDSREIKDNEVRSRDIRNNTVRTLDLRNNEVRGIDVRNSTVQGRDVALNTLTGDDINEARLGKVPSAAAADSATTATSAGSAQTAGNASTVGGMSVRKFFVKQPQGATLTEVLRGDGFVLNAGCGVGQAFLRLQGIGGGPETNVTFQGTRPDGVNPAPFFGADTHLDQSDNLDLLNADDSGAGTAVVSTTGGQVTTITYAAQAPPGFQGENVCVARGTVVSG
jgi:hypothetical protein